MSEPFSTDDHASPSRALCALHPETPAVVDCSRCGNFMCSACKGGQEGQCPSCREQFGAQNFPFARNSWTFQGVWEFSADLFKQQWLLLSLAAGIYFVAYFMTSMLGPFLGGMLGAVAGENAEAVAGVMALVFGLVSMVVQIGLTMGLVRITLDVIEGRQVDLMRMFSQFGRVPHALLAALVAGLGAVIVVGAGGLLCYGLASIATWLGVLVGVILVAVLIAAMIPMYLLTTALVVSPEVDGFTIIRQVWDNVSGHRAAVFGVLLVSGLLMIGGMMLCGVGFLPAYAFSQMMYSVVYLALTRWE